MAVKRSTMPPVVAKPHAWVALLKSAQMVPGSARSACFRIDTDSSPVDEIDDQGVIPGAEAGRTVAAATNCQGYGVVAREVHAGDDVRHLRHPDDTGRVLVEHAVADSASRVVFTITWFDQLPAELLTQPVERCSVHGCTADSL